MIGGIDVILDTRIEPAESLDLCTRLIVDRWPDAVLENAITGEQYTGYAMIPFELVSELMVYRDRAAFESWGKLGADRSNENTMMHLLAYERGAVTVVVDDVNAAETRSLLAEMADRLERVSLWREAA